VTASGIEPATFQFVAQCLNHVAQCLNHCATTCPIYIYMYVSTSIMCFLVYPSPFIHSIAMCRKAMIPCCSQELLPFLSFIYFFLSLFSTSYCIPSSLTSSCHLFLGLSLNLTFPNLGIPFFSILCTCPNQCNLCDTIQYNTLLSML
jgi:hypothetical protein